MTNRTKLKWALGLNVAVALLELLGNLWMYLGIDLFSGKPKVLSLAGAGMFKFFTIDSNVLMGIVALILAIRIALVLKGRLKELTAADYVLSLVGTGAVTLTLLVTVFFLAPTATYSWWLLFVNSNFLLHLLNPLLSIVTFVAFMRTRKIKFVQTLYGVLPMLIYAVYYMINALLHAQGDKVPPQHDWYGFLVLGAHTAGYVIVAVTIVMFVISLLLWLANRQRNPERYV